MFVFYVQKEQYKKDIRSSFVVELCSLCLRTQVRCHSLKNPTPKHTSQHTQNSAHKSQPTMAKTYTGRDPPSRSGDNDRRGGEGNRRKNKRDTTTKNERSKKKTKTATGGAMDDEATEEGISTRNEGNDDNADAQHDVTDETATEKGDSARNGGDATRNSVEGGQINTNVSQGIGLKETDNSPTQAVRKPDFSNLEKHVISSNTNISPIFAITRALNLKTITPSHQAVFEKRHPEPLILQR